MKCESNENATNRVSQAAVKIEINLSTCRFVLFLFFRFQLGAKRTQWLGQNIHDSRGGEYKAKININVMQIVW